MPDTHSFLLPDDGGGAGLPEDPGGEPQPPRRRGLRRTLLWLLVWGWLMAIVPIVSGDVGPLAGFLVLMAAFALAVWRIDKWCAGQYWRGLRDYRL